MKYNPQQIEKKWQEYWSKKNFASWHAKDFGRKPKLYVLDMFPYPSGEGLHVGHTEGYTATDIYSRWLRRQGYNVLHPMGWDAFGLPAENYAIKTKTQPAVVVAKNVSRFKRQLRSLGFSYDWQREINTTDPKYYKWTQWIFLQLFKLGLAYKKEVPINWCPSCKTGLANEEVVGGKCERCETPVEKRGLPQWILKITAYADRLLHDLGELDWPQNVKEMQRNWIGRSEGYEIDFKVIGRERHIRVFTTRIDTVFGATYLVLAPEHPLALEVSSVAEKRKVKAYIGETLEKSELERQSQERIKTGVFTGVYALNPATREKIPVWSSDYVLGSYGTGAIMAVPAHDSRDFDFATTFHLPIKEVISPDGKVHDELMKAYEGDGVVINSGPFTRMDSKIAKEKIAPFVAATPAIQYKLRDWIFSRQRYWGEPIPLVFCEHCRKQAENLKFQKPNSKSKWSEGEKLNPGWIPIPENRLPLKLPQVKSYEPTGTGESPLAAITQWVETKCPRCGGSAKRETDTMPQWAGSCWYYIAYLARKNSKFEIRSFDKLRIGPERSRTGRNSKLLKYWLPVDVYVGGVEHAVLHLLYARFWHKFLHDIGAVPTKEPFRKLINQGLILGPDGEKMSKSRGNVINPDDMIKQYGADSLRLYEMFMGPLEQMKPWDPQGIVGMHRFLNRVWELATRKSGKSEKLKISLGMRASAGRDMRRLVHKTIKKVTGDIETMRFNTAISAMMELQNAISFQAHLLPKTDLQFAIRTLISLLAPFAPHITDELWQEVRLPKIGKNLRKSDFRNIRSPRKSASIHKEPWPKYNPALIKEDVITYAVQVNGKLRDTIEAKVGLSEEEAVKLAKARPKIGKWISGKKITRTIFVKDKLLNFVIS